MVNMIETTWGAAYASYPIGAWNWSFANLDSLKKGNCWGQWHELGHLHQSPYWTFNGTVEVTVNLFSMYAIEHVCETKRAAGGWGRMWDAGARAQMFRKAQKDGGFDKTDLGARLAMYRQIITVFGWEPIKKVMREYLVAPEDELPKTDQEKRDQWMVRLSRTVGRDLSPFFIAWSLGVSEKAIKSMVPKGSFDSSANRSRPRSRRTARSSGKPPSRARPVFGAHKALRTWSLTRESSMTNRATGSSPSPST